MRRNNKRASLSLRKRAWPSLLLLACVFAQAVPARALQSGGEGALIREVNARSAGQAYGELLRRGDELNALLEKLFGEDAGAAAEALGEGSEELHLSVTEGAGRRATESLDGQIRERRERPAAKPVFEPAPKPAPTRKPARAPKRASVKAPLSLDWRQLAFGFQPLRQESRPEVQLTETDKEIRATGEDRKSFETKEAKGTRTQKAETRYVKDGKTFGMEIKDTQVIEAVSKPDGKSFRRELSMTWGAQVAACPDANGVSAGTGTAKVVSKTTYTEGGATVTMTSEFDIRAKLTGHVNDSAELTSYDMQLDAYLTNSGHGEALGRGVVKEVKLGDGRYGIHLDIPGNTIEWSDGTYGGARTPAKMGKVGGSLLTPMSDADAKTFGSAVGPMVPTVWNSANEMYKSAERNWKNYGCVEVICRAPKLRLKPGEDVDISAETVHLQENTRVNAQLKAEAYNAQTTPESQAGRPAATFTLTAEGGGGPSFHVESTSKRGVGRGDVDFQLEKEKEEASDSGVWAGTITAERTRREEREKRSGANLAENGGHVETTTRVRLKLTGRLDRTVEATNAHLALVTGEQRQVDYEYDRYKVDEGYCGAGAVPYKGPKEITRTSTTTAEYDEETRVFVEAGAAGGSVTFSLPEAAGRTVHAYVHKSPCAEHDRANTNEAIDEEVAAAGGSFSFSFAFDPAQKTAKGSVTIREADGGTTTYTWELTRN